MVVAAHPEAGWVRAVSFCSASAPHMLVLIRWMPNPVVNFIKPFALPHSICYVSHSLPSKWNKLYFFSDLFPLCVWCLSGLGLESRITVKPAGSDWGFAVSWVTLSKATLLLSAKSPVLMAFNAVCWGALQLISRTFLVGLQLLSLQAVKDPRGTQFCGIHLDQQVCAVEPKCLPVDTS